MAVPNITDQSVSIYENKIDQWIIEACRAGTQDFWHLVSQLPAVYPTVVRQSVERLIASSSVPMYLSIERPTWNSNGVVSAEVPGLPTPNPLAFDWRYTRETAGKLLERVVASTDPTATVGLLGAPSVYKLAAIRNVPRHFILLDQHGALSNIGPQTLVGSKSRRWDMPPDANNLPEVQTVLADPPWYQEETLAFLRTASRICADQGKVLLSSPPYGVRPGIQEERDRIVGLARDLGLGFLETERHALSYSTPFFEHNALLAAGFAHVMPNWRRGDLLTFQRSGDWFSEPTDTMLLVPQWVQFDIRGATIWVRPGDHEGFIDPSLAPVVPGDILPTVSRRDVRREAADVWTAGNRIYRCEGPHILSVILHAISVSEAPLEAVRRSLQHSLDHLETAKVETCIDQVERIVQTELREMRSFANGRE